MAKVKNRRDNHNTKRPSSRAAYASFGESAGSSAMKNGAKKSAAGAGRRPSYKSEGGYDAERDFEPNPNVIVGRNPVTEALKNGREIDKLMVSSSEGSMIKILAMAKDAGIPVMKVEKAALDRVAAGQAHQGVAAYISPYEYAEMEDIFARAAEKNEDPFIIILDNLEDPHNLGAILRTAEAAGAHGVIIPKRRAVGLTATVYKASAGAVEYVPVARVTNLTETIKELKKRQMWVYGLDMNGENWCAGDLTGPIAVVVGSEGRGISRLVREQCDQILSLPMQGSINSLNASVACGIVLYEVCRQRAGIRAKN